MKTILIGITLFIAACVVALLCALPYPKCPHCNIEMKNTAKHLQCPKCGYINDQP